MDDQNTMSANIQTKKNDRVLVSLGFGNLNWSECKKRVFRVLFSHVVARWKIAFFAYIN